MSGTDGIVFVTTDVTGFVDHGRREVFQTELGITIMTPDEFLGYCSTLA